LVLGAAIFALYAAVGSDSDPVEQPVVVDQAFVDEVVAQWTSKRMRPPTAEELASEVGNRVRTEVLYREGLSRGLDQGDLVIKRRVAQKVSFLADSLSGVDDTSDDVLRAYFEQHRDRFMSPETRTLTHRVFTGSAAAERALQAVANPDVLGDPSLLSALLEQVDRQEVTHRLGHEIAEASFGGGEGTFGPIETTFGYHVITVTAVTVSEPMSFEQALPEVRRQKTQSAHESAQGAFYEQARARVPVRVDVSIPGLVAEEL